MTEREKIQTRIIIAKAVKRSPDSIKVFDEEHGDKALYCIENFKTMSLVLGFDEVPTIKEVVEEVKEMYLGGCEIDFDIEFTDRFEKPPLI